MKIHTWDYKGQPDWDAINEGLAEAPNGLIYPVDTGSDQFGVVIATAGTADFLVQLFFDENQFNPEAFA